MSNNIKGSEQVAVLGTVNPSSQAAGAAKSSWVSAEYFQKYLAIVQTGVLGASATVDAKFQQAQDSSGTGAKDITGAAITQIVKASGDNVQAEIDLDAQALDVEGGFGFIQLSVTVGVAASLAGALLLGVNGRYGPASGYNATSVVQVAG
jgi:hypothetical protein